MGVTKILLKIFMLYRLCLFASFIQGLSTYERPVCDSAICTDGYNSSSEATVMNTSSLDISGCSIQSLEYLDKCFGEIHWSSVNISWNTVTEINTNGYNWQNVSIVDISYNDIRILKPDAFSCCSNLQQLYLVANKINNIQTDVFANLSGLEMLDLSYNELKQLNQQTFMGLNNLKTLKMGNNQIKFIASLAFMELKQLQTLDLSYNVIEHLAENVFSFLQNLKMLYLKGNRLTGQSLSFLKVFTDLSLLDISENRFSSFDQNAFYRLNITQLDASDNKDLLYILQSSFSDMASLHIVDFSGSSNLLFVHENAFINCTNISAISVKGTKVRFLPNVSNYTLFKIADTQLCCHCYDNILVQSDTDKYCKNKLPQTISYNSSSSTCEPVIVSSMGEKFSAVLGHIVKLRCFAVGHPWPSVRWEKQILNDQNKTYENMGAGYFLEVHLRSLKDEGLYRCIAGDGDSHDTQQFRITILRINIGVRVLTADSSSIVVTWNRTHHVNRHAILYRASGGNSKYTVLELNEYWRLFRIGSLKPSTEYEICIASKLDIHDKNCIRTSTIRYSNDIPGIRHNTGAIAVLTISGFVFGLSLLATLYKCVHKLRLITKQKVFVVNSESRETFGDVTEATFTYENQFSDFLLENENKTEF